MTDPTQLTISEALEKLHKREIKAVELIDSYLTAIENANTQLNAYVAVTAERAREMALVSDERLQGKNARPLEGIPLGIKDIFATKGVHTQACSRILEGFKPCYESTVTANLQEDGAIMLGKTNMDEFAMGSSNENSCYGPVINPWRREVFQKNEGNESPIENNRQEKNARHIHDPEPLVPGGSSGGSSAAVAAGLCAGATASDTGGSIRQPAAFTGTVGIKPTYGRCSRWGMIAYASSLDQPGPIARSVRDAAILLRSMASSDPKDSTCVDLPVPDYESGIGKSMKGMKVGVPREYHVEGIPLEIENLWHKGIDWLRDAGAEVRHVSLPHTKYALPAYYVVASAEASSNLACYDGVRYGLRDPHPGILEMYEKTRAKGFGEEVRRRILIGAYVLSAGHSDAYYQHAQKVRTLIKRDFDTVFEQGIDMLLTPTTPSSAFALGSKEKDLDPVEMYLNDVFTVTVNMAGLPAISIPAGLDESGLPLGLQLIGSPFGEESLFTAAQVIEVVAGRFSPGKWWLEEKAGTKGRKAS